MKRTAEERVRFALLRFGKKNVFCRIIVMPVLFVCMFFFHLADYMARNVKRLSMTAISLVFFAVYSSFSFPMFISNAGFNAGDISIDADSGELELSENLVEDGESEEADELSKFGHDVVEDDNTADIDALLADVENMEGNATDEPDAGISENTTDKEELYDYSDYDFSRDDWRLILINKQHSIPENYEFPIDNITNDMQCDARLKDDLLDMFKAANAEGVSLEIRSPYRTHMHQQENFDKRMETYIRKGYSYVEAFQRTSRAITVPGHSEHEVGLAFDITCTGYYNLDEAFFKTAAGTWLYENSYKYGFILRYPKDKEYITGIEFEPWHYRYVGVEAATYMTLNDMCMEEFWGERF